LAVISIGVTALVAMPGDTIWTARYNGPSGRSDFATGIAVDPEGSVYVVGRSWDTLGGINSRMDDYAVVKYDSAGRQLWVRRYDAGCPVAGYRSDQATCLGLDAAGNLYVSGASYYNLNSDTNQDFLTVKYRASGDTAWTRRYAAPSNPGDDVPYALAVRGGYVYITGQSWTRDSPERYDYITLKYDTSGNLLWDRRYHGGAASSSYDAARSLAVDAQGSVYVTGFSNHDAVSPYDGVTVKYDAAGNQLWVARYNGRLDMEDEACACALDSTGSFLYVAGYSYGPTADYLTIKYRTADGETVWTRRHNGSYNANDFVTALAAAPGGGVCITGYSHDSAGGYNYTTIKYSADGALEWLDRYDGPAGNTDQAWGIAVDATGNTYVTGESYDALLYGDYATIKYDRLGNREWVSRYNGQVNRRDKAVAVAVDNRDHAYVTGFSFNPQYNEDYLTLKYDARPIHDVGVLRIVAPGGMLDSGTTATPQAWLANFGSTVETFTARMIIGTSSTDSSVTLTPGESLLKSFAPIVLRTRGVTSVKCSTRLTGDLRPANDRALDSVRVAVHDIGSQTVAAPVGTIEPGEVVPSATVRNHGTAREACSITLSINSSPAYANTISLPNGLPLNADTTVSFASWNAMPGSYTARCSTWLASDQRPTNNVVTEDFTVRTTVVTGWSQMASVPAGPKGKNVKDGGCFTDLEATDAAAFIYGLKGNGRCEFYQYSIAGNAWTAKESIPAVGSSGKKKAVKKGASITDADGVMFAAKGNGTLEWWKYDPALSGSPTYPWTEKTSVPTGAKAIKEGSGSAMVKVGDTTFIYFLKGSSTQEFCRYNATSNSWATMTNAPSGTSGKPYKNGSALCASEDGSTVFAVKGSYNEFYAYDVATNTWTTKTPLPMTGSSGKKKKVKDGAGLAYMSGNWGLYQGFRSPKSGTVPEFPRPGIDQVGGTVYALKGGGTREFWTYQADSDKWTQLEDMPTGGGKPVKGGGALTRANDKLYAFKGNNTLEFYSYAPASAVSSEQIAGNSAQTGDAQRAPAFSLSVSPTLFRTGATIHYSLPRAGNASLKLYDVTGQLISTLASGNRNAGSYTLTTPTLARGIYVLKLATNNTTNTAKLIVE
jgi:hypothetical protein